VEYVSGFDNPLHRPTFITFKEPFMQRRNFIRLAGGGMVLAATAGISACSTDMPSEAVAAWQRRREPTTTDVRRWILSYAILAPHSHNLQSWIVDLAPARMRSRCSAT
jgi:hypothetical protein